MADQDSSSAPALKNRGSSFFGTWKGKSSSRSPSETPSRNPSVADINVGAPAANGDEAEQAQEQQQRPPERAKTTMTMLSDGEKKRGDFDIRPLTKPGHYGNLDIAQAKQLSAFKRALTKTSFLPDPAMVDEEHQDTILLRFLRARDWNVQHAFKMYSDTIKWRKDVDLPSMMQGSFDFEERDKVAAGGWKMYFHGTDKFHRPIFVQDLAGLNTTEVFTHTTPDRVINFFACMLEDAVQRRYRACTSVAREHARDVGFEEERVRRLCVDDNFMILNVAGIGMGTFWAFKGQLQQLLGILDTNFPELSGRVQIINAPWLFSTIWSYIKGWLPVNTAEKIDIVGTDFKAKLLEFIDEEQLPSSIGGSCQCGGKGCEFSDIGPWQEAAASRTAAAAAAAAAGPSDSTASEDPTKPSSSSASEPSGVAALSSVESSVPSSEVATPPTAQSSVDAAAPSAVPETTNAEETLPQTTSEPSAPEEPKETKSSSS